MSLTAIERCGGFTLIKSFNTLSVLFLRFSIILKCSQFVDCAI